MNVKDEIANQQIEVVRMRNGLELYFEDLSSLAAGRERAIARTKIQEAIMWLDADIKRTKDAIALLRSNEPTTRNP